MEQEAQEGMGEMPALNPVEDDGELEEYVEDAMDESPEPVDESDTPDDEDDEPEE